MGVHSGASHRETIIYPLLGFVEGEKPDNRQKNPQSKSETNNELIPLMIFGARFKPWPHWREVTTPGGTPRKIGWGCAARFPKPLNYL